MDYELFQRKVDALTLLSWFRSAIFLNDHEVFFYFMKSCTGVPAFVRVACLTSFLILNSSFNPYSQK
jgi:hypothetical protein